MNLKNQKLKGIVPPVITPLNEDGSLDVCGLEKLIFRMINGGVSGLFILGTTGEGPALSLRVQKDMITETIRINSGKLPILVGISNAALNDTLEIADFACSTGADALVCAPPCYFMLGDDELMDYFQSVAAYINLPLFLYNMPGMTKTYMKPALVMKLAALPGIIGYKDSSGNMCDLHEILIALKDREDFSIFVGPEELLAEAVLFGADGGVAGGANLNPELFVATYKAAVEGDLKQVRLLQEKIYRQRKLYSIGRYQSSIIKGIKCALDLQRICNDTMASPFLAFRETERNQVKSVLEKL